MLTSGRRVSAARCLAWLVVVGILVAVEVSFQLAFYLIGRQGCASTPASQPQLLLRSHVRGPLARRLRTGPLRASFLDEMGQNMKNFIAQGTTGMTAEESEVLMQKCRDGTLNLDDFFSMLSVLNRMGGVGGAVGQLSKVTGLAGGDDEVGAASEKLENYKAMLSAMTPEERKDPEVVLGATETARLTVARVAKESGRPLDAVNEFLMEFRTIRSMFQKLGQGKDMEDVVKEISEERKVFQVSNKPRKARRAAQLQQKGPKGKKGSLPEWMTL